MPLGEMGVVSAGGAWGGTYHCIYFYRSTILTAHGLQDIPKRFTIGRIVTRREVRRSSYGGCDRLDDSDRASWPGDTRGRVRFHCLSGPGSAARWDPGLNDANR